MRTSTDCTSRAEECRRLALKGARKLVRELRQELTEEEQYRTRCQ